MKACAYCRRENSDEAVVCCECGTSLELVESATKPARPAIRWREIPHDPVLRFRALVIGSTALYTAWWFHLLVGGWLGVLSTEAHDGLSWHGVGAWFVVPMGIAWLIFFLNVAVAIGLWSFSASARIVFVALIALSMVLTVSGGIQVNLALGSTLQLLVNTADGAILYAAYATPLKEKFA